MSASIATHEENLMASNLDFIRPITSLYDHCSDVFILLCKNFESTRLSMGDRRRLQEQSSRFYLWGDILRLGSQSDLPQVYPNVFGAVIKILKHTARSLIGLVVAQATSKPFEDAGSLTQAIVKLDEVLVDSELYFPPEADDEEGDDYTDGQSISADSDSSNENVQDHVETIEFYVGLLMNLTPSMERLRQQRMSVSARSAETTSKAVERSKMEKANPTDQDQKLSSNDTVAHPDVESDPPSFTPLSHQRFDSSSPISAEETKFRDRLIILSKAPLEYENPGLLDESMRSLPLDKIHSRAEGRHRHQQPLPESSDYPNPREWGYQDFVVSELLRWFKQEFFTFINNPRCSVCVSSTVPHGTIIPTADETAYGAVRVELYQCSNEECRAYERFPRYSNVWKLMQTRRGRAGEGANCFSMLCRAVGSRVRWVWCSEDHVWTEIFSEAQKRWIHVDPTEGFWDNPLLYTKDWGRKLAYCIAFSIEGATDVTHRYVRESDDALPRTECSEEFLRYTIGLIRDLRRANMSNEEKSRLEAADGAEETEFGTYDTVSSVPRSESPNPARLATDEYLSKSKDSSTDALPTGKSTKKTEKRTNVFGILKSIIDSWSLVEFNPKTRF